jgi:hypothetical protein
VLSLAYLHLVRLIGLVGEPRTVGQLELENALRRRQLKVLRRTVR